MLIRYLSILLIIFITSVYAEETNDNVKWSELKLVTEYPVDNMPDGNLSGIALCDGELWVVSDRSDLQIYKLTQQKADSDKPTVLRAEAKLFNPPSVPKDVIALWDNLANMTLGILRGGAYDFEGISCDIKGNKYLVSEAYLAILKLPKQGQPEWLKLPDYLWPQAKSHEILQKTNQMFEGIAISPDGQRLWLAAERNKRGILALSYDDKQGWYCPNHQCVILAEGGREAFPPQFRRKNRWSARDFSDLAFYKNKLFTLERSAYRICRRSLKAEVEQCWSYAQEALQPQRQYYGYGMPEALWVDDTGAWIGIDNDIANKRVDGETRPIVWRFASPEQGWLATTGVIQP